MKEDSKEDYPLIPDGLITYLENKFPDKYPTKEISPYQLGYGAGEQGIIQHLKLVKQWSEENVQN